MPVTVHGYTPATHPRRILLCNPPIYDTRFPWARFQQPTTLLQLSTPLRGYGCDVRLLDALSTEPNTLLRRRRMRVLKRDGISLNWWRFGRLPSELTAQLVAFKREKWQPDEIYIVGFTTFWWEGVVEIIKMIRQRFPHAQIILCGAYPTLATAHAEQLSEADIRVVGHIEGLAGLPLDLSLYESLPTFSYLSIGAELYPASDLVKEFLSKVTLYRQQGRVWQVAFADHDVAKRFPEQFRAVLKASIDNKCKVSFFAPGNLHPNDLIEDHELASLLQRAGFKQLVFADDRHLTLSDEVREKLLDDYSRAIELCVVAGYPQRTEALVASVCLGRPGENPAEVIAFMTNLAHIAGSLMVIPYQPDPTECPDSLPLDTKLRPHFQF